MAFAAPVIKVISLENAIGGSDGGNGSDDGGGGGTGGGEFETFISDAFRSGVLDAIKLSIENGFGIRV